MLLTLTAAVLLVLVLLVVTRATHLSQARRLHVPVRVELRHSRRR